MKIVPEKASIDLYNDGFSKHDRLNRAEVGEKLSTLVERIDDPMVIALDGAWGCGKSHFLKCWVGAHTLENCGVAQTIYFDAFEHDYLEDPLVALTLAIAERFEPKDQRAKIWERAKGAASTLWRPALRTAIAVGTAGFVTRADEAVDAGAQAITSEFTADAFWKREESKRQAMMVFREALTELTQSPEKDRRKLVIVVDELDRCRPDYALTMLEVIKHFFTVPNVHFVLGVSLAELQNSVRARYGQGVDAKTYLHKFVTLQFGLPETVGDKTTSAVIEYFDLMANNMCLPQKLTNLVRDYLRLRLLKYSLTIRDAVKILTLISISTSRSGMSDGKLAIIAGLIVLKHFEPDTYGKISLGFDDYEVVIDLLLPASADGGEFLQNCWRFASNSLNSEAEDYKETKRSFDVHTRVHEGDYIAKLKKNYVDSFTVSDA